MKNLQTLRLKKRLVIFISLLFFCTLTVFAELNLRFPKDISIYSGESLYFREGLPYTLDIPANTGGVLSDSGEIQKDSSIQSADYKAELKLFGFIPVKTVNVNVLDTKELTAGGKTIGIKLFTKGLVAVGVSDITDKNGSIFNIGHLYDIKTGDIILSANEKELNATEELGEIIAESNGSPIKLTIMRDEKVLKKEVVAINTTDGYKLGIWVRDSTAGIGTLTFLDKQSLSYGALGHPITDADTGALMPVSSGAITEASVIGINKGAAGAPGELKGIFKNSDSKIGEIYKNTDKGIYGKVSNTCTYINGKSYPIASRNSIKEGKAYILSNIDGDNVEAFEIEIERVMRYNIDSYKDLVIEVTDSNLLAKTGGIVQGMCGSPIIQDGKLIGAVTHVFVNDPTKGYGIFIDNMLSEAE